MPGAEEEENVWREVLKEAAVGTKYTSKVLMNLGDRGVGKTLLTARLLKADPAALPQAQNQALEYAYIDVRNPEEENEADGDIVSRIGVWNFRGDESSFELTEFALNSKTLEDALVCIVVDLSKPWQLVESLEKWIGVLKKRIAECMKDIDMGKADELKRKVREEVQFFSDVDGTPRKRRPARDSAGQDDNGDEEDVVMPLKEGILKENLGVPILVVCTKSDTLEGMEKEHSFREFHFEFIQRTLRKFCLTYGASLIYCSAKEGKNCETLHKYIQYRLYGFDVDIKASLHEKDSIFVPSGWDSLEKIDATLLEAKGKGDMAFEEVIPVPQKKSKGLAPKSMVDGEETVEDEQDFLARQKKVLEDSGASSAGGGEDRQKAAARLETFTSDTGKAIDDAKRVLSSDRAIPSRRSNADSGSRPGVAPPAAAASAATAALPAAAGGAPGASNDAALTNFFQSLLNRERSTASNPFSGAKPKSSEKSTTAFRKDAEKALDGIRRQQSGGSGSGK